MGRAGHGAPGCKSRARCLQNALPDREAGRGTRACTGRQVPRAPALRMVSLQETHSFLSTSARAGPEGSLHRRDRPCRDGGTAGLCQAGLLVPSGARRSAAALCSGGRTGSGPFQLAQAAHQAANRHLQGNRNRLMEMALSRQNQEGPCGKGGSPAALTMTIAAHRKGAARGTTPPAPRFTACSGGVKSFSHFLQKQKKTPS